MYNDFFEEGQGDAEVDSDGDLVDLGLDPELEKRGFDFADDEQELFDLDPAQLQAESRPSADRSRARFEDEEQDEEEESGTGVRER